MNLTNPLIDPKNDASTGPAEAGGRRPISGMFVPRAGRSPGAPDEDQRMETRSKPYLIAGDVVINPALLAFAAVETDSEGIQLRLGFAGLGGQSPREIRLCGLEARSVLKWLRSNAEFLDSGSPTGRPHRVPARGDLPACPPHFRGSRAIDRAVEA